MDTAVVVTVLALVLTMAGVSRSLQIQEDGVLNRENLMPGSSEDNMAEQLLELVRHNHNRVQMIGHKRPNETQLK